MRAISAEWSKALTRLVLLGVLGVWPLNPAAAAEDFARFVYLTGITTTDGATEASLFDRFDNKATRLSVKHGSDQFQVRGDKGAVRLEGRVLFIGTRDLTFRADGKTYRLHVGDNVAEALWKPLADGPAESRALLVEPQYLQTYPVPAGRAEDLTKVLQEVYRGSAAVRFAAAGPNVVVVWASPDTQRETARLLQDAGAKVQKPAEKTFAFEMRNKPWKTVFEWLTEHTGIPVLTSTMPTGSFSFISPKGKTYTLPEVIDVLNEALAAQKYLLLRRERSFLLVPADEKIDPTVVPRVSVADLARRGTTELVSVVVPLKHAEANDIAPDIKKLLGPFGQLVAVAKANQLILQDTAGNLRRVLQTIRDIEDKAGEVKRR